MHVSGIRLARHAGSWYPAQSNFVTTKIEAILEKEVE